MEMQKTHLHFFIFPLDSHTVTSFILILSSKTHMWR